MRSEECAIRHLSARVITDSTGTVVGQRAHYPYGETWYETGTTTKIKFTSYERDSESSNDFAMMRYSVNRLGRFNAPDPVSGSAADPQTWNRFAYVGNNPINHTDPSGLLPSLEQEVGGVVFGGGPIRWMTPDQIMASIGSREVQEALAAYEAALAWTIAQIQAQEAKKTGGGVILTDEYTNGRIRKLLPNLFSDFAKSNCARVFSEAMGGFIMLKFRNKAKDTNYYDPRNIPSSTFTQNDATGNGNSTSLNASLSFGVGGRTINGGLANQTAILLGPNFFSESSAAQSATLLHENVHGYTGWSDDDIFGVFAGYGLQQTGQGSQDISDWIQKDCPPKQ